MTAGTVTPYQPGQHAGRDGFAQVLWAEWTKFRTVRGWVIGTVVAVLVTAGFGLFAAGANSRSCQRTSGGTGRTPASLMPATRPEGRGRQRCVDSSITLPDPPTQSRSPPPSAAT